MMHVTHVQEVWHRPKGGLCGIDLVWHTHIKRVCVCVWHTPCVAYTHQKEACHTLKDTNSHTHSSALRMVQDDISMSLITHMHESCPTYALASHICMSLVPHTRLLHTPDLSNVYNRRKGGARRTSWVFFARSRKVQRHLLKGPSLLRLMIPRPRSEWIGILLKSLARYKLFISLCLYISYIVGGYHLIGLGYACMHVCMYAYPKPI